MNEDPPAFLEVESGPAAMDAAPIYDRLVIGRECAGVDARRCLLIDDPQVSRHHLEIRLDHENNRATVMDMSTNGTRINGVRIERAVTVPIRAGDRLSVGRAEMIFRSEIFRDSRPTDPRRTARNVEKRDLVLVVGDLVNYSTLSETTASDVVYEGLEHLYRPLRDVLDEHRGTFVHYQGDAFFAYWEQERDRDAPTHAVEFALAAVKAVDGVAGDLPIRNPDGTPVRMGWAVVVGDGVVSSLTGTPMTVLGDATNVAFRLSGLAGRGGRDPVVVTAAVRTLIGERWRFSEPEVVEVKGRTGRETLYGVR